MQRISSHLIVWAQFASSPYSLQGDRPTPCKERFACVSLRRLVGALLIISCAATQSIVGQQSTEASTNPAECELSVHPIDEKQLAQDPAKTRARAIAQVLQDTDSCLGAIRSKNDTALVASEQATNAGSQSPTGSHGNPTAQQSNSDKQQLAAHSTTDKPGNQRNDHLNNQTMNASLTNQIAEIEPNAKQSNLKKTTKGVLENVKQAVNPNTQPLGVGNELVLDEYAKSLQEAYQAETDPAMKAALLDALNNYLENE